MPKKHVEKWNVFVEIHNFYTTRKEFFPYG